MQLSDARIVERFLVDEFCQEHCLPGLPVMLSTECDRVEVDLSYCPLTPEVVQDWLAQRLGRLGYLYDFWFPDMEPHHTLCVSVKETEE